MNERAYDLLASAASWGAAWCGALGSWYGAVALLSVMVIVLTRKDVMTWGGCLGSRDA